MATPDAGAAAGGKRPRPDRRARSRAIVHTLLFLAAAVIVLDALAGDRGLLAMLRVRREYRDLAATVGSRTFPGGASGVGFGHSAGTVPQFARKYNS